MNILKLILGSVHGNNHISACLQKDKNVISPWSPFTSSQDLILYNILQEYTLPHSSRLVLKVKFNWYRKTPPINSITVCVYVRVEFAV